MSSTTRESTSDQGLAEQASSRAQEAASTAQDKASELKERGTNRLAEQLDQRSTTVGSQARSFAGAIRRGSEDLRGEGKTGAAGVTREAADRIEQVGSYLEQKSGDEVLRDVEEFARRRPWAVAGAAALIGMAASRFLKASSERRFESRGRADRFSPAQRSSADGDAWPQPADSPATRETGAGYGSSGFDPRA